MTLIPNREEGKKAGEKGGEGGRRMRERKTGEREAGVGRRVESGSPWFMASEFAGTAPK